MRSISFFAALVVALALAAFAMRPPSPLPADAPETVFSADRAMRDVETIAAHAHPIGSADIARVRDHLVNRLIELGLVVTLHGEGRPVFVPRRVARTLVAGRVRNVGGILKGTSPELPAILLMSHYDTVPNSPGAADDTAGVAATLEILRALKAAGPLKRDVIVLFTEGEEAGLLGSRDFFDTSPLASRIGLVLNLEARGGGGRTFMFETSDDAGGLISALGSAVARPSANSLMSFVYHRMPNGTDLSNAIERGIPGMNFAFIGDEVAYHTAYATPAHLDRGSLQHMGDQVLALTQTLANAGDLRARRPDLVYSDIFGLGFIAYPFWAGWILLAATAGLLGYAAVKARAFRLADFAGVAQGAGVFVFLLLAEALTLRLAGQIAGGMFDVQAKYAMLARHPFFFAGCVGVALATALLVFACLNRARSWIAAVAFAALAGIACNLFAGFDPLGTGLAVALAVFAWPVLARFVQPWGVWIGGFALLFAAALALQIFAPATSFFILWPFLLAGLAAALVLFFAKGDFDDRRALAVAGVLGALAAALIAQWGAMIFLGVGSQLPAVIAGLTPLAALALFPGLLSATGFRRAPVAALALLAASFALVGWAAFGPAGADHPRLTQAFYMAGPEPGRFARVSTLPRLDAWSEAALTADGGKPERTLLLPGYPQPVWNAPAQAAAVARPALSATAMKVEGGTRVTLRIVPAARPRELRFVMKSSVPISGFALDGRPAPLLSEPGKWSQFLYAAPPAEGITLSFTATEKGAAELRVFEVRDGWPAGIAVPPKPPGLAPFQMSDTTFAASALDYGW
ncbi:MAG: M20/M25/M40 family metallo-hydrolase [Parvibaculum sp.]|uniref:M20/M25/M40 family metallo-hydrolase n=1 Tax=Parvibaculum sp. TaxID=2024848 RepID=UPI0025D6A63F|nr:M20/M25/M40 family metallo-hydrolase [Parvibaculum sp.]MCE9651408.1 M20/M25/M40 family metallo-hydrolase [Parvibaculum sp.]